MRDKISWIILLGLIVAIAFVYGCDQDSVFESERPQREYVAKAPTPQEECTRVGGSWLNFPNTCVDSCEYRRATEPMFCGQAMTDGCECGPNVCWNGQTCEPE